MVRDRRYIGSYAGYTRSRDSRSLTIKLESAGPKLPDDFTIPEASEPTHLRGHHNGVVVLSRSRGKRDLASRSRRASISFRATSRAISRAPATVRPCATKPDS